MSASRKARIKGLLLRHSIRLGLTLSCQISLTSVQKWSGVDLSSSWGYGQSSNYRASVKPVSVNQLAGHSFQDRSRDKTVQTSLQFWFCECLIAEAGRCTQGAGWRCYLHGTSKVRLSKQSISYLLHPDTALIFELGKPLFEMCWF